MIRNVCMFEQMENGRPIAEEIRETIFCTAAKYVPGATHKLNEYLFKLLMKDRADSVEEVVKVATGLGCSGNETVLKSYVLYLVYLCWDCV